MVQSHRQPTLLISSTLLQPIQVLVAMREKLMIPGFCRRLEFLQHNSIKTSEPEPLGQGDSWGRDNPIQLSPTKRFGDMSLCALGEEGFIRTS